MQEDALAGATDKKAVQYRAWRRRCASPALLHHCTRAGAVAAGSSVSIFAGDVVQQAYNVIQMTCGNLSCRFVQQAFLGA